MPTMMVERIPDAYTTNGAVVNRVLLTFGCFVLVLPACGGADMTGTNDTATRSHAMSAPSRY